MIRSLPVLRHSVRPAQDVTRIAATNLPAAASPKTLDRNFDLAAYQSYRDNSLPKQQVYTGHHSSSSSIRNAVRRTAVVIGCDEAGRGPLAGPVFAAACCCVPLTNDIQSVDDLRVNDSKQMPEKKRKEVLLQATGFSSLQSLDSQSQRVVISGGERLGTATLKSMLKVPTPSTVLWKGKHVVEGRWLFVWSATMANHASIDEINILQASLACMHHSAHAVWSILKGSSMDSFKASLTQSRPELSSTSVVLHLRELYDNLEQKRHQPSNNNNLFQTLLTVGAPSPLQPPLVLIDGSHCPKQSVEYFSGLSPNGAVYSVVKGDTKSYSIALASNIAKCLRDDAMGILHKEYPEYDFASHMGYPTLAHRTAVQKHGPSPVHRKTFTIKSMDKK